MTTEPHTHGVDELCDAGSALYARALAEGRIHSESVIGVPCLADFGLLRSDGNDTRWLLPTPPAVALPRLLRIIEEDIAHQRHRETKLADLFEPLMTLGTHKASTTDAPSVTLLHGFERINSAISEAMARASRELLTVQPGGTRAPEVLAAALPLEQALLTCGGRMRTLYQHTTRHALPVLAHFEQLDGDVEVRTLDEVTERLVVIDRTVAYIPANKDRTAALEVRQPALVDYLATAFERFWRLATPMHPRPAPEPSGHGISTRQRAVAGFLVEGLTDSEIAARLGLNVRTARVHIAKLAATLGSKSRAQLGYLIGRSGILDQQK
ncbi:LuxR C-terminal-related transcriptional regulator [Streptomyces sp. NPDC048436]|uniref:helix-turn-helix transcriptional regulator n=1 Tax=Streptomyces sp. NPDC048436 TaxID=3365550 RepID=UPI003722EF0E